MDSNSLHDYQDQHHPNSGLLRFRSVPTSFLVNFSRSQALHSDVNKANNPWESSESDRLISSFVNNDNTDPSGFQELDGNAPKSPITEAALNLMNSQQKQGYNNNNNDNNNNSNGLPPYYPGHNSTASSPMDSSYGFAGSFGMNHQTQSKPFASNLLRQSSSPAGLFSNISFPNGIY